MRERLVKTVTIRNIPPKLERAIRQRAGARRTSMNKAVMTLLEEHLGVSVSEPAAEYHDLDELAGVWSEREARPIEEVLAKQRAIDRDLWK
jgi:plasmid stability protein